MRVNRVGIWGMGCLLLGAGSAHAAVIFEEGFDSVVPAGWIVANNSIPLGTTSWFQGNTGVFDAQAGAADSYAAANLENAGVGSPSTISDWLVMPALAVSNGSVLSFYTRSAGSDFPDNLEVRFSDAAAVGSLDDASLLADFSLLLAINPALGVGVYPDEWTQYTVELSGLPGTVNGRFAFRYFVTDAGPLGINSDYIGIDTVSVSSPAGSVVPEPGTVTTGVGLVVLGLLARNWKRS